MFILKTHFPQVSLSEAGWCTGLVTGDDQAGGAEKFECGEALLILFRPPVLGDWFGPSHFSFMGAVFQNFMALPEIGKNSFLTQVVQGMYSAC